MAHFRRTNDIQRGGHRLGHTSNPACLFLLWTGLELVQSEDAPVTLPPRRPPLEEPRERSHPTLSLL